MENMILSLSEGQLKLTMKKPVSGAFALKEVGLSYEYYKVEGGNLRIKVEMGYIQEVNLYKMPVIEFEYSKKIGASEWIVEFNGVNILEKKDHSGQATVLLLNRKKMEELEQRHENILLIHGDFSEEVSIKNTSNMHLIEIPGQQ